MAVEKRIFKNIVSYRAYWRNPFTKKIERGALRSSRKDAEADDDKIKYRLKHERDSFIPSDFVRPALGKRFGDIIPLYLQRGDLEESTRESEFYHLKSIDKALGPILVEKLCTDDLRAFEKAQVKAGRKQNTIHRRVCLVRSILNWAVDEKIIAANPIQGMRFKRGEDKKIPPPSPYEIGLMIDVAPPHLKRAIILSYYLGVRVGESELLRLHWDNFMPERRRMRVWSAKKNKKMPWRDVDLVDSLFQAMMEWYGEDGGEGFVITFKGKPVGSIKTAWKTALRNLKQQKLIPESRYFRPYDMRHAFGTETLAGGADPGAVANTMGHRDTSMLRHHYQHVLDEQKIKVSQSVPDVLRGIQSRDTKLPFLTPFSYPDE